MQTMKSLAELAGRKYRKLPAANYTVKVNREFLDHTHHNGESYPAPLTVECDGAPSIRCFDVQFVGPVHFVAKGTTDDFGCSEFLVRVATADEIWIAE